MVTLGPSSHIYLFAVLQLHNTDHTNSVVQKVLEKYDIECREGEYYLSQVMPDGGELLPLPASGQLGRRGFTSEWDKNKGLCEFTIIMSDS